MNYLSVERLTKSFNERVLFEDLTFGIGQGDKVALVGLNGSGKSTLLKILAGLEEPDSGFRAIANDVKLAYVGQQPEFDSNLTVIDAILSGKDPVTNMIREYEFELIRSSQGVDNTDHLTSIIDQIEKHNAWNYENKIKEVLGRLEIHDLDKKIAECSGGQKKRIGLAKVLLEQPDLIILDEPTNHLDLDAIEWLEAYISTSNMALIMVTHDRYFLDNVTSVILELDDQTLYRYKGNYAHYLEKKQERETVAQAEKDKARNQYKKELDWMRRQPKARGTKAKYRIDAFDEVREKAHKDLSQSQVMLSTKESRQGRNVLELNNVSKSYNDKAIINGFSYLFKRGDRIGIVGKNGSGKSTLLNILTHTIAPDSGEVILGQTTKVGYYQQSEPTFKPNQKVIEVVQEIAEVVNMADGGTISASRFLTFFNFSVKAQYDYVEKLSGGEKRRLQLLLVLIHNPNFLVLDEPTNDLDLDTLRVLEGFLSDFKGCVVIVSHDRYFMDRLVDHLFILESGEPIQNYSGNYTAFRAERSTTDSSEVKAKNKNKEAKQKKMVNRLSYGEKREFEQLEKDVEKLTSKKKELEEQLNSGETDHEKLTKWGIELKALEVSLDEKETRWLELAEIQEN
ncbi:MAG: ABC-F family ATP-binding cassette domain-containing protein [Bacteroidota bacterium]